MEKIKKYITRFLKYNTMNSRYDMCFHEMASCMDTFKEKPVDTISLWLRQRLPCGHGRNEEGRCSIVNYEAAEIVRKLTESPGLYQVMKTVIEDETKTCYKLALWVFKEERIPWTLRD